MKKTKKTIVLALLVVLVFSCGVFAYIKLNKPSLANVGEIKIGATLPLSGSLAYIGKSEMNGLIMAADEINSRGGINGSKINIVTEDNQGEANIAVTNAQKLLDVDNVSLIFSTFTPITRAISPLVKAKNIPMIFATVDGGIASESDIFFRDYFDAEQMATALFKKVNSDKRTNIKVIAEQSDGCKVFVDSFKKEALSSKVKVGEESYFQPKEIDFRTHLLKLGLKNDDALLVCAAKRSNLIMKNLSEMGLIEVQTYQFIAPFLPVANELSFRELYTKNKTISTWYGFANSGNTEKQEEFIKNYKERFKEDPIADSTYSYDDVYILADVLKKCMTKTGIDNGCFRSEMVKIDYTGVAGRVSFGRDGKSSRDTLLIQAEDNQWKNIK